MYAQLYMKMVADKLKILVQEQTGINEIVPYTISLLES